MGQAFSWVMSGMADLPIKLERLTSTGTESAADTASLIKTHIAGITTTPDVELIVNTLIAFHFPR
jgi:hypothetical protein